MKKKELYELAKKHKEKHKIKPKKPLSQMNKNELTAYLKMTPDKNNIINSDERKKKNSKSKGSIAFLKAYYANEQNLKNIKKAEKKEKQDKKEDNKPAEKVEKKAVEENKLILKNAQNKKVRIKLKKAEKIEMIKMLLVLYKKEGLNADVTGIPVEIVKKAKKLYEKKHKGDEKESMKEEDEKRKNNKDLEEKKLLQERKKEHLKQGAYKINDPEKEKGIYDMYNKNSIEELKKDIKFFDKDTYLHARASQRSNYSTRLWKLNILKKVLKERLRIKKEEPKKEDEKRKNNKDLLGKKINEIVSVLNKKGVIMNMKLLEDTHYNDLLTKAKEGKLRGLKRMEKLKKDNLFEEQRLLDMTTSKEKGVDELIKKSHSRVQNVIDIIKEKEKEKPKKQKPEEEEEEEHKPPPPEQPIEEKPKIISKPKKDDIIDLTNPEQRERFYKTVNTFLTSKSKRGINYLRKDYGLTNKQIDTIEGANNWADFYPTPSHCINNEKVKNALDGYSPILEPTAGLGNIMNELLLMFPKVKLIGNEYMPDMAEFLKSMYPKLEITNNNFLKMDIPDNTNAIVCNPPFSFGNDKKFYYDFLFKILADMNNKKNDYMKPIIFICPELVSDKRDENNNIYEMMGREPPKRDDFTFSLYDILQDKRLSIKKLISLCKIYLDITITPKQAKLIKEGDNEDDEKVIDIINALEFVQGKLLMKCKGFGGTSITANVYEFILYKNYRKGYGEEPEKEEPKKEEPKKEEPKKEVIKKEKPYNDRLNKFIQNGKKHNKKKHCYSLNNQPSCRKNQPHCK